MELATIAQRAVEAAQAAGATDAEAYVQDSVGREIRIFDGEVESLTDAGQRGLGVRCWIDHRSGYAYGTDLSDEGLSGIAAGAVEAARIADPDEFAAAPEAAAGEVPEIPGLADPSLADWTTEQKIELAKAVERAARAADERVVAVETTVYADEEERVALASSTGLAGILRGDHRLRLPAGDRRGRRRQADRPRLRDGPLAAGARRRGDRPRGRASAPRRSSARTKPASRTCPVVLDPIVAASFVGFIGGTLCADAVQRGRSPFAGSLGEEVASAALTLTDDGIDPAGLNSSPLRRRGRAPRHRPR